MKKVVKAITGLACIALLVIGATTELTVPALITAGTCIAWLALVGIATFRRQIWKEN